MRRRKHYRCQRLSDVKHQRVTGDKKLPLNRSDSVMWKERLLSERQWSSREGANGRHPGTQYQFHRDTPTTVLRVKTEICCSSTSPLDGNIIYLHSIATSICQVLFESEMLPNSHVLKPWSPVHHYSEQGLGGTEGIMRGLILSLAESINCFIIRWAIDKWWELTGWDLAAGSESWLSIPYPLTLFCTLYASQVQLDEQRCSPCSPWPLFSTANLVTIWLQTKAFKTISPTKPLSCVFLKYFIITTENQHKYSLRTWPLVVATV